MAGCMPPLPEKPRPLELAARLLIAAIIAVWLASRFAEPVVRSSIPLITGATWALSDDFVITSTEIEASGTARTLRVRANLSRPIAWDHRMIYPFGWERTPLGEFEVSLTLGGMLQYCALLLTLVLAWPAAGLRELMVRIAVCPPLLALLLLIDVPFTIVAELRNTLQETAQIVASDRWMVWSRFMMGGGGAVLAIVFAGVAIVAARRLDRRHPRETMRRLMGSGMSAGGACDSRVIRVSADSIARSR